jgi:hypothetical protein
MEVIKTPRFSRRYQCTEFVASCLALQVGATSCICLLEDYKNLGPLKKNLSPLLEGCFVHWWQLGAGKDNFDHKRLQFTS